MRKASTTRRTKKRNPNMMHGQKKTEAVGSSLQSEQMGATSWEEKRDRQTDTRFVIRAILF